MSSVRLGSIIGICLILSLELEACKVFKGSSIPKLPKFPITGGGSVSKQVGFSLPSFGGGFQFNIGRKKRQVAAYSQSTTYQTNPYGQTQTVVVKESQNQNGQVETTVTKTVTQPQGTSYGATNYGATNYGTNNYGATNYAATDYGQQYSGGFGRKKRQFQESQNTKQVSTT
jgi:hypothetical protein